MKQKKRLTNVTKMVIRDREGGIALPRYHFQRLICVTWSRCRRCCGQSPCHHLLNVSPVCWYLGQTIRFRRLPGILYLRLVQLYQLYAVCFYHSNIMVFFIQTIVESGILNEEVWSSDDEWKGVDWMVPSIRRKMVEIFLDTDWTEDLRLTKENWFPYFWHFNLLFIVSRNKWIEISFS